MKAIYRGVVCHITDSTGESVILDHELEVPFGSPGLIVDPTDEQVEAAEAGSEIPADPDIEGDLVEIMAGMGASPEVIAEALAIHRERYPKEINSR